ncbi:MAG TPA: TonB-dependent receptor plug domain-containing protein, partial [Methylophilaceae bacterium]|nr:TonB-dependent receptor plug domain-containing protein [Methylophilaceae bacterium]
MKKTVFAALLPAIFANTAFSAEPDTQTKEVLVTANRFERKDTETTYASEIHTAAEIEASGSESLYDFLLQHSSVNVLPSAGNRATPLLDMRGYGAEGGFQNIVITVDGQRLNNIDLSSQLIGAIPLSNIDRIEITKGSGSVLYGDGAVAGTIQIHTKSRTGVTVRGSAGNYGSLSGYASAGIAEEYFDLSASLAHDSNDGYGKKDMTGHK